MSEHEVTTTEIMEFLKEHVTTKEDFGVLEKRMGTIEGRMGTIEGRMGTIEGQMATKGDLAKLKAELIDSMDDKLADLKADLIVLMRRGDRKLVSLINLLFGKRVITDEEAKSLLALEPFPQ